MIAVWVLILLLSGSQEDVYGIRESEDIVSFSLASNIIISLPLGKSLYLLSVFSHC